MKFEWTVRNDGPGAGITYRGIYPEDVSMAWSCTMGGGIWAWHLQPDIIERNGSNGDLLRLWGTSRAQGGRHPEGPGRFFF